MKEELEIRFNLQGRHIEVDAIKEKLGDKVTSARSEHGIYVVTFEVDNENGDDDQLWQMFCEIGTALPGATLVE